MIVHPIGMMRANAASGLNFVDDFTTYTLGTDLGANNPPWLYSGGSSRLEVADSGGVRVARHTGGQSNTDYTGTPAAHDREVSVTVKSKGQQDRIELHLSYQDGSNYCKVDLYTNGFVGPRQSVAGTNAVLGYFDAGWVLGDKISMSRVGTTIKIFKNGVQVGSTYTGAAGQVGAPRLAVFDAASPSSTWEISQFELKDL